MTINDLIEQIGGRERLAEINADGFLKHGESKLMAHALLAMLDTPPVGWVDSEELRGIDKNRHATIYKIEPDNPYHDQRRQRLVFLTPPAASASAVNFDLSKPGTEATVITNYHVPDGWKLVPLKAFPSQWAAGQKAFDAAGINKIDPVYHAMVEAAPAPGGDSG